MFNRLKAKFVMKKVSESKEFRKYNAVLVMPSTKVTDGVDTGNPCITFGVVKKQDVKGRIKIPKRLYGVKTDVIEVGEVLAFQDNNVYNPLKGGCEIQFDPVQAKLTLTGVFDDFYVKIKNKAISLLGGLESFIPILEGKNFKPDSTLYALSNSHGGDVRNKQKMVGTKIRQPFNGRVIGEIVEVCTPLEDPRFDTVKIQLTEVPSREVLQIGKVKGVNNPVKGLKLQKYGRTSNYTTGTVVAYPVSVDIKFGSNVIQMQDMVMTTKMLEPGDSGSAMYDLDGRWVAQGNAGSELYSFGIPSKNIIRKFKVSL